ncbi:hypothetical protein B4U79_13335, partial [Dinothrombium tinctorium]
MRFELGEMRVANFLIDFKHWFKLMYPGASEEQLVKAAIERFPIKFQSRIISIADDIKTISKLQTIAERVEKALLLELRESMQLYAAKAQKQESETQLLLDEIKKLREEVNGLNVDVPQNVEDVVESGLLADVRSEMTSISHQIRETVTLRIASQEDSYDYVPIRVDGQEAFAMIDNGATRCYMKSDAAKRLNLKLDTSEISIVVAFNNTTCESLGIVNASVSFGNSEKIYKISFIVIKEAPHAIVIGKDFLKGKAVIDYVNKNLLLHSAMASKNKLDIKKASNEQPIEERICKSKDSNDNINIKLNNGEEIVCGKSANIGQIRNLIKEVEDIFLISKGSQRFIHGVEFTIDTGNALPTKHKLRPLSKEDKETVERKIKDLLERGIIRSSNSEWASAIVLVPKADGSKRMCGDYRDLNKATRRDSYPLPNIESILQSLSHKARISKLDCQDAFFLIPIKEEDRCKTAIITHLGLFEYNYMPFGLKNASAAFQRVMDSTLDDIKGIAFGFIDDIFVTSEKEEDHLHDLEKALRRLQETGVVLKPNKVKIFQKQVEVLGHLIDINGISPQPIKVQKVLNFQPPTSKQQLQSFLGTVNYLSKFMPNCAKLLTPLRGLLKKKSSFKWQESHQKAFDNIKKATGNIERLSFLDPKLSRIIDLESGDASIAATLYQNGQQKQIVDHKSRSLSETEQRYLDIEKEALALHLALTKFKPYMSSEPIVVRTKLPHFKAAMEKKSASQRMTRILLDIQDINFTIELYKGIKNIAVDDIKTISDAEDLDLFQNVFIDGACKGNGSEEAKASYACWWGPKHPLNKSGLVGSPASNQRAELTAAIVALETAVENDINALRLISDSSYLVKALNEWLPLWIKNGWKNTKGEPIANKDLFEKIYQLAMRKKLAWKHVAGHSGIRGNEEANLMATQTLDISETAFNSVKIADGDIDFKEEQKKDEYIQRKAAQGGKFIIYDKVVFRNDGNGRRIVVPRHLIDIILKTYHDSPLFGGHFGVDKTYNKIYAKFWWKGMKADVEKYIASCHKCQIHKPPPGKPVGILKPISTIYPMEIIGIDFVGPIRETTRGNKYIIVAIDHFSSYLIAKAISEITAKVAADFVFEEIICRFGVPKTVLTDQGVQFQSKLFRELINAIGSKKLQTSSYHPQCNGKTERANQTIKMALKKYCSSDQRDWDKYLKMVVFAYNNSKNATTGFSPFEIIHGFKPIQPQENIKKPSTNQYVLEIQDRLDKIYKKVASNLDKAKSKQKEDFDSRHRPKNYSIGDKVLIWKEHHTPGLTRKFEPKYFGPYEIVGIIRPGIAYKVKTEKAIESISAQNMKSYNVRYQNDIEFISQNEQSDYRNYIHFLDIVEPIHAHQIDSDLISNHDYGNLSENSDAETEFYEVEMDKDGASGFSCSKCRRKFIVKSSLDRHEMLEHPMEYICEYCGW